MYKILLQQFIKQFGRVPSALEKILLKQKATKQAIDQRKVLDLKGNPIDPSKPIIGGTQELKSGIMRATGSRPTAVKTEAQIKSKLEGMNKKTIERIKRRRYEAAIKAEKEKAAKDPNYIPDIIDPDDFLAGGGRAGYHKAGIVHAIEKNKKLEKDLKRRFGPSMLEAKYMDRKYPKETYRPYKSLEDVPPEVLAILMQDPTFDPETFLKMDWAAPGHTYSERKYRGDEKKVGKLPRGTYYGMSGEILLNFPKFSEGEKGKVAAPFLDFDKMSNKEKAQVILHEMRHKNILEKEQLREAQPEWVKKNPGGIDYAEERAFTTRKGPEITKHPGVKYKELEKGFIPEKYLTGHELFNWFMDARKFGAPKGKEWYPYFDKILKDHWEPHAKEIDKRSMELKLKPKHLGLAGGGIAGMLGEPTYQDDNHRVPLKDGSWKPPLEDENILEGTWKNMGPWEKLLWGMGLLPFEKGGRVDLAGGGLAAALRFLMQKYGKDVIKLAKDVKPSKKWDTQKAVQEFKKRNPQFKAEGGRVPMWMGGALGVGKGLLREMLKYFSKGSTHGKSPVEMLKMLNPKQFNEMLNTPGGIPALAKEMIEKYTKTMKKDRADTIGEIISSAKKIKKVDDSVIAHKKWMVEDMVKKGSDRKTAEMFADGLSKAMAKTGKDTPKITERGLLELENIHKNLVTKGRPLNAKGGLARMLGE